MLHLFSSIIPRGFPSLLSSMVTCVVMEQGDSPPVNNQRTGYDQQLKRSRRTFVRQFAQSSFPNQNLEAINSNILSAILVLTSLLLFYILLKFTTYYISLGFLAMVTLLHYWFGSKWCLDMILARLTNVYTLMVVSASYPKISAVVVLGNIV